MFETQQREIAHINALRRRASAPRRPRPARRRAGSRRSTGWSACRAGARRHAVRLRVPGARRGALAAADARGRRARLPGPHRARARAADAAARRAPRPARRERCRQVHADARRSPASSPPLAGRRVEGHGLVIGYFAQHQLEQLRPDESPLAHLARAEPATRELELRSYLGHFDFRGAMADAPVGDVLRRRALAPGAGDDRAAAPQPAAARRADQPPRPRDAPRADARAGRVRGQPGAGLARPRAAAHRLRRLPAGGRRRARSSSTATSTTTWRGSPSAATREAAPATAPAECAGPGRTARAARDRRPRTGRHDSRSVGRWSRRRGQLERQIASLEAEKRQLEAALADVAFYAPADRRRSAGRDAPLRRGRARRSSDAEERWLAVQAELEAIGEP